MRPYSVACRTAVIASAGSELSLAAVGAPAMAWVSNTAHRTTGRPPPMDNDGCNEGTRSCEARQFHAVPCGSVCTLLTGSAGGRRRASFLGSPAPRSPQHAERPAEIQALSLPGRSRGSPVDPGPRRRQAVVRRAERRSRPCGRGRRRRQRPPVWPLEVRVAGGVESDAEALLVHRAVVAPAKQHEVVEGSPPAVGPVRNVMSIAATVAAAREPALPVAGRQRPAEGGRHGASATADVEDLAAGSVAHRDPGGVARNAPGGLRGDVDATRFVEHGLAAGWRRGRCSGDGRRGARARAPVARRAPPRGTVA